MGHIIYMLTAAIFTFAVLFLLKKFVNNNNQKDLVLKIFALLTIFVHFSSLWIEFLKNGGNAEVQPAMLFPIYPCNVCMWFLLVLSLIKDKKSTAFTIIAEFAFYLGVIGGGIGVLFNENYANNPNLFDYEIFKGLLSHSIMIANALYLFVGGFVKIRVKNLLSVSLGLIFLVVDGFVINTIFKTFNIPPCNSMYLEKLPFGNMPFLNTFTMGLLGLILVFCITAIYEQIFVKKENRWYTTIFSKSKQKDENETDEKEVKIK